MILFADVWSAVAAVGTCIAAIAAAVAAFIAWKTAQQNSISAGAATKSAEAALRAAEANERTAELMRRQLEQQAAEAEASAWRFRAENYPHIAATLEGGYFDSGKSHATFNIVLKNQHYGATAKDVHTSLAIENPDIPGDWHELHPAIWQRRWDDMGPQSSQAFPFPTSSETQSGRSVEEFLIQWFPSILGEVTVPWPSGSGRTTYYTANRPINLNVRFIIRYTPAIDGAIEQTIEQRFVLKALCEAREDHPAEVEHPSIVTRWQLRAADQQHNPN